MKKVKYIFSFFCFLLMTQGCTTVDKTDENSLQRIDYIVIAGVLRTALANKRRCH